MSEPLTRGQERARLREMLLQGTKSQQAGNVDAAYFDRLRARIFSRLKKADRPTRT